MLYRPQSSEWEIHVVAPIEDLVKGWAVVEYMKVHPNEIKPPTIMLIIATPLQLIFTFADAQKNSEWRRSILPTDIIKTQIHGIGDKFGCMRAAAKLMMSRTPMPHCNLYGVDMSGRSRRLICSNGQEYASQTEAAEALGLNQSLISRHLKGHFSHVGGFTFIYKE